MSRHNIYRDGRIHVLSEQCSTCIFRPGNLMQLSKGRVKEMVELSRRNESCIVCHQTLGTKHNAVCRGFFDKYPTAPLQLAQAMGFIEEQELPEK